MSNDNKVFSFQQALVGDRWLENVCIEVSDGIIQSIENTNQNTFDRKNSAVEKTHSLIALPGMVNVHSHAFQRAFAGMSEYATAARDSFWTWRSLMYQFVESITIKRVATIARQLYREMLAAGYTWVGEFHYLHHVAGQSGVDSAMEMAGAVVNAAKEVGIGICLLPAAYQRGGFKDQPLVGGQTQFELDDEQYCELLTRCWQRWDSEPNVRVGVALHSLRAISEASAKRILHQLAMDHPGREFPIHVHIAEQLAEIEDCISEHDERPVDFLLNRFNVNHRWCLIHATHMSPTELSRLATSDAVVGLCPTTEANLGDGIFLADSFLEQAGTFSIGSDSHCSIDLREELRWMEYVQRLQRRQRAVLGNEEQSVGRRLYCGAAEGGAQAIGIDGGVIEVGRSADFTLVDPNHPAIGAVQGDRVLDRLIFTNVGNPVAGVVVGGCLHLS
ncbi:MAG: formimidoylglutamate deiminase [Planctomycetota bacterium]